MIGAVPRLGGPTGPREFRQGLLAPSSATGPTVYTQSFTATLAFAGLQQSASFRSLGAALSFAGSFTPSHLLVVAFTAGLSFTGVIARNTRRTLTASVAFTGAQVKAIARTFLATLPFSGSISRRTSRGLAASGSFTGSITKRTSIPLTASVGGTGALVRSISRPLTAALSFSGKRATSIGRPLTAFLSFSGTRTASIGRALSGAMSFLGNLVRSKLSSGGPAKVAVWDSAVSLIVVADERPYLARLATSTPYIVTNADAVPATRLTDASVYRLSIEDSTP